MAGVDKVVNFKDFLRPNKEIKYFSRTLQCNWIKDFSRRLLSFKTFSRLYEPCACSRNENACLARGNLRWWVLRSRCEPESTLSLQRISRNVAHERLTDSLCLPLKRERLVELVRGLRISFERYVTPQTVDEVFLVFRSLCNNIFPHVSCTGQL